MKINEAIVIDPTRFCAVLREESCSPQDLSDAWGELWMQLNLKMKRIDAEQEVDKIVRSITHNVYEYRNKANMAIAVEQEFGEYENWIAAIPYDELAQYKKKIGDDLDVLLRLLG